MEGRRWWWLRFRLRWWWVVKGSGSGCWGGGGFMVDENGGGVIRNGERFTGGEGGEGGAGETEGTAVVGVSSGEVVTSVDSFFHETATVFAASHCVFVF